MKKRAEFYHGNGRPFLIGGKPATISTLDELPDHLFIPTGFRGCVTMNKFQRLAVSTDGVVGLYWLCKTREHFAPGGTA